MRETEKPSSVNFFFFLKENSNSKCPIKVYLQLKVKLTQKQFQWGPELFSQIPFLTSSRRLDVKLPDRVLMYLQDGCL